MAILCQLRSTSGMALDDKVDLSHLLSLSAISAGWATSAKAGGHKYTFMSVFTTILKLYQCRRFIDYAEGDITAFEKIRLFWGEKTTTLQLFASGFDPLYQQCCGGAIRKATLIIQENDAATTCTIMASINGWLWLCDDDDDTATHKVTNFGYTHVLTCCLL